VDDLSTSVNAEDAADDTSDATSSEEEEETAESSDESDSESDVLDTNWSGDYVTRCLCGMQHNDEFMISCDQCEYVSYHFSSLICRFILRGVLRRHSDTKLIIMCKGKLGRE
jgi:hypothetical protein